jgi:hypothetical protein
MGIQYGNITLHGLYQKEVVNYLSGVGRDAYVSPTINQCTIVYDKAGDPNRKDIATLIKLEPRARKIINQYRYGSYFALVCLAVHLSEKLTCSALAVHVYDGSIFWYYLCQNGGILDEYITCGDNDWQPGKVFNKFSPKCQIKGGAPRELCTAFGRKTAIDEVEIILRKPDGNGDEIPNNLSRYSALLNVKSYPSPVIRHEALARALGICPGWVLCLNYNALNTGELGEYWEEFRYYEGDNVPSVEEVELMLKKTSI